jgi:hypothetical protein
VESCRLWRTDVQDNRPAIEQEQIRAYVPLSEVGHRTGKFRDTEFVSDPATEPLPLSGRRDAPLLSECSRTYRRIYQAPAAACSACALRAQCMTSPRGRRISRSLEEASLERVRGYHETEDFAKAMRTRKVWAELLFAEAKDWNGLRRFRLRARRT